MLDQILGKFTVFQQFSDLAVGTRFAYNGHVWRKYTSTSADNRLSICCIVPFEPECAVLVKPVTGLFAHALVWATAIESLLLDKHLVIVPGLGAIERVAINHTDLETTIVKVESKHTTRIVMSDSPNHVHAGLTPEEFDTKYPVRVYVKDDNNLFESHKAARQAELLGVVKGPLQV